MQSPGLDVTILKKMGLPVGDTPGLGPWRAFLERRHKAEQSQADKAELSFLLRNIL